MSESTASSDNIAEARIMAYMNEERPSHLLLYSWMQDSTIKRAKMISIDSRGFQLEVTKGKSHSAIQQHVFRSPIATPLQMSEVSRELEALFHKASARPIVLNAPNVFMGLGWPILLIASATKDDLSAKILGGQPLLIFSALNEFLHNSLSFTPNIAAIVLILLILTHVIEALYAQYLLRKLRLNNVTIQLWFAAILIFGFGVTQRAVRLDHVRSKAKKE